MPTPKHGKKQRKVEEEDSSSSSDTESSLSSDATSVSSQQSSDSDSAPQKPKPKPKSGPTKKEETSSSSSSDDSHPSTSLESNSNEKPAKVTRKKVEEEEKEGSSTSTSLSSDSDSSAAAAAAAVAAPKKKSVSVTVTAKKGKKATAAVVTVTADKDESESGTRGSSSSSSNSSSGAVIATKKTSLKVSAPIVLGKKKKAEESSSSLSSSSSSSSELESDTSSSSSYSSSSLSSEPKKKKKNQQQQQKKKKKGRDEDTSSSSSSSLMTDTSDSQNEDEDSSSSNSNSNSSNSSSSSSGGGKKKKKGNSSDDDEDDDEDDEGNGEAGHGSSVDGNSNVRSPSCSVIYKGGIQSGYRRTTPTPNIVLVDSASSSETLKSSSSSSLSGAPKERKNTTPGVGIMSGDIELVAVNEDEDDEDEGEDKKGNNNNNNNNGGDDDNEGKKGINNNNNGGDDNDEEDEKKKKNKNKKNKKKVSILAMIKKPFYHIIYSIRGTTITFFVFVFIFVLAVFGSLALYTMSKFKAGDYDMCDDNLNSVVRTINDDSVKLRELLVQFAQWDDAVEAVKTINTPNEYFFRQYYESNFLWDGEWITDLNYNLVAIYDANHTHLFSEYYLPGVIGVQATKDKGVVPAFFTTTASQDLPDEYHGIVVLPDTGTPMILAQLPITYSTHSDGSTMGYMIFAKNLEPRVKAYAEEIAGCLTIWVGEEELAEVSGVANGMSAGYIATDGEWIGSIHHNSWRTSHLNADSYRVCPQELEFDELPQSAAGYIKVGDEVDSHDSYFVIRVDLPETMYDTGKPPTGLLFGISMGCILVFIIVGYTYLDLNVLHRLSRIKKFLEKFKREHEEELAEAKLEKTAGFRWRKNNSKRMSSAAALQEINTENAVAGGGGSAKTGVPGTSDSSTGTGPSDKSSTSGDDNRNNERDEIGKLGAALIFSTKAMERDIAVINRDIRTQRRWRRRFELACRLMNFWGGRTKAFPGLYSKDPAAPDYALTNYNDMTIDVLLSRPICMEFLRIYAETGEVQENILFLLDVSWLKELERAFDDESDVDKRDRIQETIKDSVTHIFSRYIKSGAPNELNIAGDTMASIRAQEGTYYRGMFSAVIAEIKMLVATDVLIKFKSTAQYAAMSEALDIELHELVAKRPGAFDDYDLKKISSPGKLHDVGVDRDFIQIFQVLLMIDNGDAGLKKKGAMAITATTPTPTPTITPSKDKKK